MNLGFKIKQLLNSSIRADLNCANALGSDPVLPVPQDFDSIDIPLSMTTNPQDAISANPGLLNTNATKDMAIASKELKENFRVLKYLSNMNASKGKWNNLQGSDKLFLVERSFLTIANAYGPGKFINCGCLASTIFIDNTLRDLAFNARIIVRLVSRLRSSMQMVLNDIAKHETNTQSTRAILWVLSVGAVAALSSDLKGWFNTHLNTFCNVLDLPEWNEAEALLKEFLWSDFWECQGKLVWEEIEKIRAKKEKTQPTPDEYLV